MTVTSRRWMASRAVAAAWLTASVAFAWKQDAPLDVAVHHHQFNEIRVTTDGCTIQTILYFDAPEEGYSSRSRNRNHFRFRAKIELSDKKEILSPIFANKAAGKRMYRFKHDTTSNGCWAQEPHKVFRVDVDGCRSQACQIDAFR